MQIKRLAALSLAAVFTAGMLAGCDLLAWLAWLEENSDSSSVTSSPSSSSSISRPSYDDDEDDDDAPSQPPAEPEKPAPNPEDPKTWTITDEGKLEVPKDATTIPNEAFKDNNNITSLDLTGTGVTGKQLEALLGMANITANKNTIPKETLSPFITSGVRLGTPAVTTRGMKEPEMVKIAQLITRVVREGEGCTEEVKKEVLALCERFPLYDGCVVD